MVRKLVGIIGKPGSGKTTIGHLLGKIDGVRHFSYGQLLKEVRPNPSAEGYSLHDRDAVDRLIRRASRDCGTIVVDWNPQPEIGFRFISMLRDEFDTVFLVHLCVSDEVALNRMETRNRKLLVHEGEEQQSRIDNFNRHILPLINGYKETYSIFELEIDHLSPEVVVQRILDNI